jgi:ParB/RepB/Spo0J family partition protein
MARSAAPETRAGEEPSGLTQRSWEEVPLEDIDAGDTTLQFRFLTRTGDLQASLKHDGQQEPIDLAGEKPYKIVDGFRRVAAAKKLGWKAIKAFLHDGLLDDDAWCIAFTKNVVRKNLSPMERANAMLLAQKRGTTKTALPEVFGLSERQVDRYLKLLEFPGHIQKILDGRVVTMAHAKLLAAFQVKDGPKWKRRIEDEKLDVRALKKALLEDHGSKVPARKKILLKKEKDRIRLFPMVVRKDAPPGLARVWSDRT